MPFPTDISFAEGVQLTPTAFAQFSRRAPSIHITPEFNAPIGVAELRPSLAMSRVRTMKCTVRRVRNY